MTERFKDWAIAIWVVVMGALFLLPPVSVRLGYDDLAEISLELQWSARYVFIFVFVVCLICAALKITRMPGTPQDN